MSQKYPYTNTGDDFLSHQHMYTDSYQRQSNTYRPSVRSSSQEQKCSTTFSNRTVDSPVNLPGMALSFLHSCGLDSSDLAHLAELPEHLITVETLPKLLLQVKERKLSSTSSSRPSTSQPLDDTSTRAWEGSSHTKPVEYPIDRPAHPVYPLPPEQVQTWQDRWGNPRRRSSLTTGTSGSSSKSSSAPDYIVSKDNDPYSNTTDSPEASSRTFVDFGPRPLLSLRLEPPVIVPTRKEASDYNCKIPPAFPHVCCLCDISIHSTKDWLFHVRGSEHAKGQLHLVRNYPKWDQTVESARRNESSEVYKVPTRKEASDFNGTVPPVFPYLCVLCNITVFSEKDWSVHITGGQHAQSQLDLMGKYPEWDGTVRSSRRNDGHTSTDIRDEASIENTSDKKKSQVKDELSSRVVSFTPLPVGEGITAELTAIAKHFGSVKRSLFLPNRGFVEMTCLTGAKKLVEHYSANQLKLKGKLIQVTFSCEYNSLREAEVGDKMQSRSSNTHRRSSPGRHSIQKDSPSPRRRRSSEKTHSSPKRTRSSERTHSGPKRKRSSERTHSSPKRTRSSERTHSSPKRRRSSERTPSSPKTTRLSERTHSSPKRTRSSERTHSSPKRTHSSERTHSSPKRTRSSEKTHSSPKRKRSSERTHSSPKRTRSSERTHSSPKRTCSSERTHSSRSRNVKEREDSPKPKESSSTSSHSCHSSSSAAKDEATKSSADTEEKRIVSNDYLERIDSDSDLEGIEVIADDGEELVHDIDDYEPTSDQENLPSMDITNVHPMEQVKTGKYSPNADTSETSNSMTEGQKFEEHEDQELKEEEHDFPKILENCVTLDEFTEENFSDSQESDEPKPSIQKAEVSHLKGQSDKESESPTKESTSKTTAEPNTSENLEDTVDQPKEEQDTERVTDDLKETFGKVLEVRNLPSAEDYADSDFMKIIKRYGDVTHHVLFRSCKKGFIEMALTSDAERIAADSKNQDIVLRGNILKIKVSEKYCHVPGEGFSVDSDSDDEEIRKGEISKESNNKQQSDALNGNTESLNETLKTNDPVGTEFVRPVVGYFCNLCNVIYASEEEAKDEHCRSAEHHEKVKEHKERSGSVETKK
ncbi:matrin 3-like 1.1 isoform X4 [Ictalurus furcatus]|uniref:matrin 3-like 1.1 isoform X4 n=1 Tax=Ictalurus furcatus TaxID=66913 RepID=UPI00234FC07A|nr:matrin 3-like 1.1 isoform X4 [Ictalurus furcatus]